jgi:hypothetical protein
VYAEAKIQELAKRKMRSDKPELTRQWRLLSRFLRKIRAIAIGKSVELLDVFFFQSGKQSRLRLLLHPLTARPIPLAPPQHVAADNDLPGSERTFLHSSRM